MKEATVLYPHQLFETNQALQSGRMVYLIEEPLFLTEFPTHTQKLLLHRLSMQAYKLRLQTAGYEVTYLAIQDHTDTDSVFVRIAQDGCTHLHIIDTTDFWLEQRITKASLIHHFTFTRYESPLFILPKDEAVTRYKKSKKQMAKFYKELRIDKKILIDGDTKPLHGKWSFDDDNRKRIPKDAVLPHEISSYTHKEIEAAKEWLSNVKGEHYGGDEVWVPWTHKEAKVYLHTFLRERLDHFGDYEDAIVSKRVRLFHSTLSPLINIGLLTPLEVIEAVVVYNETHHIPFNNIEGFVRQVLGWREFIRASYECDGSVMRSTNFWDHTRPLPKSWWRGDTGIHPIDACISSALTYGYNHHIERLMVLGNFMLLSQIHPDEVYTWFMGMYVDAYDWVMVPNVYGMSQFADGGIFATKPYISGSNYLKKMSDYQKGEWENIWTALYWNFIATHATFFISNHRLSMMPRLLEKMSVEKRNGYLNTAKEWLKKT